METQNDLKAQDLFIAIELLQLPYEENRKLCELIDAALAEAYRVGKAEGKEDERERIRIGYPAVD